MKILITGDTGFLGSHLVKSLNEKGYSDLTGLSTKDGDISARSTFEKFENEEIDHVFHLAAQTFVPRSWDFPEEFISANVLGTTNVLEFCKKKKASFTLISSYLYGRPDSLPIKETDKLKPNNPYMLSKCMAEQLCEFYATNFQMKICSFRPFNIFGFGQSEKFLVPSLINQAIESQYDKLEVFTLHPKRDYIYVKDVVSALVKSLEYQSTNSAEGYFEPFNLASGSSHSVGEVAETIKKVFKTDKPVVSKNMERKNEVMDTVADISKIKDVLGWTPAFTLEEGLRDISLNYKN